MGKKSQNNSAPRKKQERKELVRSLPKKLETPKITKVIKKTCWKCFDDITDEKNNSSFCCCCCGKKECDACLCDDNEADWAHGRGKNRECVDCVTIKANWYEMIKRMVLGKKFNKLEELEEMVKKNEQQEEKMKKCYYH